MLIPERPPSAPLSVLLLHAGDVPRHVLNATRVLHGEAEGLGLHARLVDEHAGVGCKSGESERQVLVQLEDLADRARLLELGR